MGVLNLNLKLKNKIKMKNLKFNTFQTKLSKGLKEFDSNLGKNKNAQLDVKVAISIATISLLLRTMPSGAGVVLYEKPQLKNYVEEVPAVTSTPKYSAKDRSKSTTSPDKAKPQVDNSSGGFSPQVFVLPSTVVGITGLALLAYKLDSDFASFVNKSSLRPSDVYGAGYETVLKDSAPTTRSGKQKL